MSTAAGWPRDRDLAGPGLQGLAARHRPRCLPRVLPLAQRLPLVVVLLASCHRDLDLRPAVEEIQGQRDHGQTALARGLGEPGDLVPVQQQLALATRLVVVPGSLGVLGVVPALGPGLAMVDAGEAAHEGRAARPERLPLGAGHPRARLDDVLDVVVVARLSVARDELA